VFDSASATTGQRWEIPMAEEARKKGQMVEDERIRQAEEDKRIRQEVEYDKRKKKRE